MLLLLPLKTVAQQNILDTIVVRTINSGESYDGLNSRSSRSGNSCKVDRIAFVSKGDTIDYHYVSLKLDSMIMNEEIIAVIWLPNSKIVSNNLHKYLCSNSRKSIIVVIDLENEMSANVEYVHNAINCGDVSISEDPQILEHAYHTIKVLNYEPK